MQLGAMTEEPQAKRLQLYLNGILAITTRPLNETERLEQIENWKRVYGHGVKIETVEE